MNNLYTSLKYANCMIYEHTKDDMYDSGIRCLDACFPPQYYSLFYIIVTSIVYVK